MATDNTPPRLRLIATIATIVVITLIGLNFVFESYYGFMTDEARREKIAPTTARSAEVAAEQAAFAGAKMPLEQAAAQLKASRSELIEPKPSDDLGAMTGWSKLPKQAPAAAHGAAPAHGAETHTAEATDGGAALTTDGGATPTTTDAGATPTTTDAGAKPTATDAGAAPKGATAPTTAPKDAGARTPQH